MLLASHSNLRFPISSLALVLHPNLNPILAGDLMYSTTLVGALNHGPFRGQSGQFSAAREIWRDARTFDSICGSVRAASSHSSNESVVESSKQMASVYLFPV